MTKLKIQYFLLGAVIAGPILSILLMSLRGIGDKPDPDYVAVELAAKGIRCPAGAQMEYRAWGKSGRMAICQIKQGPFIAAESGYVHIRGQYENGKAVGIWTYYDANGKIDKEVDESKASVAR